MSYKSAKNPAPPQETGGHMSKQVKDQILQVNASE